MSKDPAFLMYSKDWLTGTQFMSMEERGMYVTLIMAQHQNGHLDTKRVGFLLGLSWDMVSDIVKEKFKVDENGFIFNTRLEEEREKRAAYLSKQAENGRKGGRPKKPKQNPDHNPNTNPEESIKGNAIANPLIIEQSEKFYKPNEREVILFFDEKGYTEKLAKHFFAHYNARGWCDTNMNPVEFWKVTAHRWFDDKEKKGEKTKTTREIILGL